jgi:D-alanine-D-alanine ligase
VSTLNNSIILFGGSSEERMVSVASAQNLSRNMSEPELWFLNQHGGVHKVSASELSAHADPFMTPFVPKAQADYADFKSAVKALEGKTVLICLHGTEGEDGTLQLLLETHKVKFTGSGSEASALAFDKKATKALAKNNNLPIVTDLTLTQFSAAEESALKSFLEMHKKVVMKPLANGSSVGLYIVDNQEQLLAAFKAIKDNKNGAYLVEPFITGREITVGVWEKTKGNVVALPCSEIQVIHGRQFDYEGKYLGSGVKELTPAPLTAEQADECQKIALSMHQLVGCKGYSRTDMILTDKGPFLLEINTLPGLSKASFIPQQLAAIHVDLRTFFESQLAL